MHAVTPANRIFVDSENIDGNGIVSWVSEWTLVAEFSNSQNLSRVTSISPSDYFKAIWNKNVLGYGCALTWRLSLIGESDAGVVGCVNVLAVLCQVAWIVSVLWGEPHWVARISRVVQFVFKSCFQFSRIKCDTKWNLDFWTISQNQHLHTNWNT